MTYYNVLGVTRDSSYDEIKAAFHHLARTCHPDKIVAVAVVAAGTKSNSATSKEEEEESSSTNQLLSLDQYRQIQQAWEILRDETRRKQYNQELEQADLRNKAKRGGALSLQWSDLEEAQEEDTGETIYVYDCRCGEELVIIAAAAAATAAAEKEENDDDVTQQSGSKLLECPGCCFVYQIPKNQPAVNTNMS